MRTPSARPLRLLLASTVTAALLVGCSAPESLVGLHAAPAENTKVAPLTQEAATRIATRVSQQAAAAATLAADEPGNAARDAVLAGTFAEVEKSRIGLSGASATATGLSRSEAPKVLAISEGKSFPRVLLATTLEQQASRQYLESFESAAPTDPFRLENRVPMLPGATLPALPTVKAGAPLVSADDGEGLVMSPQAAVDAYAAGLTYPTPTANEAVDSTDSFATLLVGNQKKQAEALGDLATYAVSQSSVPEALRAFRLADGGAVVFGRINRSDVLTAGSNTKELTVPEAYQKLTGTATATTSITINSMQPVVLLVPAAGKGKVTLLGVLEQLVSGSAS